MGSSLSSSSQGAFQDPREIAKWARRYAKSRTIPFLVQWVFIVLTGAVIAGLAYLAFTAVNTENVVWTVLCVAGIVGMGVAFVWFMVPRWGGDRIYRISQWVYGVEGYAEDLGGAGEQDMSAPWWVTAGGVGLAVWHMAAAFLIVSGKLPVGWLQPFSALYMTPFLIAMILSQRLGVWALLWPLLYGLHAVVVLLVPMKQTIAILLAFNILLPVFGYGLVAILVGHIYSRFAFRKLKALARQGLDEGAEDTPEEED